MNSKRNLLAGIMLLSMSSLCTVAVAQEPKPLRFGVEIGGTITNVTDAILEAGYGYYAGVRGTYSFEKNAYVAASLRYIQKGIDGIDGDSDADWTYTANYLELPVALGLQGRIGKRTALFGETGPYIAYGICGKDKGESYAGGPESHISWDRDFFSKENGSPRRFDWGWHARAGVRFSHVELSLSYERGLHSIWKDDDSKNTCWAFGVGYNF